MRVKICGLSRPCDIDFVNEARPDFCGFVFAKSRRQVTVGQAEALRGKLSDEIIPVGVFVNEPLENVVWLLKNSVISWPQLHGAEDENYIAELRLRTDGKFPIIRAVRVDTAEDLLAAQKCGADFLLLDHGAGGTGKTFDWSILNVLKSKRENDAENAGAFPLNPLKPFFLAGGICLENVDEAMKLDPYALDLSSGVETNGFKDRNKILELVRRIKNG